MKAAVYYSSSSGNTRAIAEAIGSSVSIPVYDIRKNERKDDSYDFLFIGGPIHIGNLDRRLRAFLKTLTVDMVKEIIVFSTAQKDDFARRLIDEIVSKKNIKVSSEAFFCQGKFSPFKKNIPAEVDIKAAEAFAKRVLG